MSYQQQYKDEYAKVLKKNFDSVIKKLNEKDKDLFKKI